MLERPHTCGNMDGDVHMSACLSPHVVACQGQLIGHLQQRSSQRATSAFDPVLAERVATRQSTEIDILQGHTKQSLRPSMQQDASLKARISCSSASVRWFGFSSASLQHWWLLLMV